MVGTPHVVPLEKTVDVSSWRRYLDAATYVVAFYGPIVSLPQVWKIWVYKTSEGVSMFTWGAFIISTTIWLLYGVQHKQKPIIITSILWLVVEVLIVTGGFLYR